ncbi:CHAP domain-containing protein [Xanthobacter sp. KR7-65]|uniref:CHAP domain-containing protein n=1 Tax=Xanthobacter sp. KR7-65 TaxID=3156612 RepID=UPI0032B3618C
MLLKRGMIDKEVAKLAQDLSKLGFYAGAAGTNYNAEIEAAVKAFQSENLGPDQLPLVVDGQVGPLTRWAIDLAAGRVAKSSGAPGKPPSAKPAGSSSTGWNALKIAQRELAAGAGEKGGDNRGTDVMKYHAVTGASSGDSWCASFVSYCFDEGNPGAMPFQPSASAREVLKRFKQKGWDFKADVNTPPAPGDIVVWWRGAREGWMGHIGIVSAYENGLVHTIEGNRGPYPSKVSAFYYVLGRIDNLLGFGRAMP